MLSMVKLAGRLSICKEVKYVEYQVNLGFFEGPLDLLLHLVKKNKLEINNISLAAVTEQYLGYIRQMQERDLDSAGEFIATAAQLMALKARTLLPVHNPERAAEEDNTNDLVARLLEYKQYKEMANLLKEREEFRELCFSRDNEKLVDDVINDLPELNPLENVTLDDLRKAFLKALREAEDRDILEEDDEEDERPEFKVAEITVKDKMLELEAILEDVPTGITFGRLFSARTTREEVVVTFLALLEMIKLKKLRVAQSDLYGEIMLTRWGD